MTDANVVDELVVVLRLKADEYKKAEKQVDDQVDKTESKQKDRDVKRKRRDEGQQKRWRALTTEAKAFTKTMGAVVLAVAGLGAAIVGSLTSLNAFELGLRRQGVSTGLSNRELQAWGSTARRLGADADAGADAIANLAKEQKQFRLTGEAPTLQAFARAGINVSPDMAIPDILANAQNVYRRAAPAQQQHLESTLSAQGVSPDLILMIKSETDAREAYTRSLAEASTENRKALDAVSDALAAMKASAVSLSNTLATALQPVTERVADWLSRAAVQASAFADRVAAAGGGLDGFMTVVNKESPTLGATLHGLEVALDAVGQVVDVVAFGLKELWQVLKDVTAWASSLLPKLNPQFKADVGGAWEWTKNLWSETVKNARANGPAPAQTAIDWINAPPAAAAAAAPGQAAPSDALALTSKLVQNGLSVPQAAAVVANWQAESSLNPANVNREGGGTGARGLAQWRGPRTETFRARYGVTPDQASVDQQIQFMLTDPYEKSKLAESFAGGGDDARALGSAYSRVYEAHGDAAADAQRGQRAADIAAQYQRANGAQTSSANGSKDTAGNTFSIQSMTVVANTPNELATGIARQSGVQSYNSAVR
jgi:hypothetical protein